MVMYLDGVPTFTIMIIGRWSSDAFLRYIRKQVKQFTHNVSCHMLQHDSFFTTTEYTPQVSCHDTRSCQDPILSQQDISVESLHSGSLSSSACRREAGSRHIGTRLPDAESSWAEGRLILGIQFPQLTMSCHSSELYHLL